MNWRSFARLTVGGIVLAILLCLLGLIYINYQRLKENAEFAQTRVKICNRLIEADLITGPEECGSGTNPNLYLPILFPEGVSVEYVSIGMQDFELHSISGSVCKLHYYQVYNFIFERYVAFHFCDSILAGVDYQ